MNKPAAKAPVKKVRCGVGAEEAKNEVSDVDDDDKDTFDNSTGIGPYATESYRHIMPLGLHKDSDFAADDYYVRDQCAQLIVADMTTHFNLGLIIPEDAPRDYKG